jgi:hypothetical protein
MRRTEYQPKVLTIGKDKAQPYAYQFNEGRLVLADS